MSIPTRVLVIITIGLAILMINQCADLSSAPSPLDHSTRHKYLSRDDMVGDWEMTWAGQRYKTNLAADGAYSCGVFHGSMLYNGTWSWRCGLLWISEYTEWNPTCLRTYSFKLDPWTLSGVVVAGSPGTTVSFKRRAK